jgi:lipoprotein-anchoring transpeptidase ErfK/SrfK
MIRLLTASVAFIAMITAASADVFITIDKSEQLMYVDTEEDSFIWKVSTGRKGYNTPVGMFKPYLIKKIHYSSKYDNAPMPFSIFFVGGYAIHATSDTKRLGQPASHGCIRLSLRDARWLYHIVKEAGIKNTYIEITN